MNVVQRALEMSQKHSAIIHKNLALALMMSGDYHGAESHYHTALKLYPKNQPPPKVSPIFGFDVTCARLPLFATCTANQYEEIDRSITGFRFVLRHCKLQLLL